MFYIFRVKKLQLNYTNVHLCIRAGVGILYTSVTTNRYNGQCLRY